MQLEDLISSLRKRGAFPGPIEPAEVRHIDLLVVFLEGPHVYKIKKPVQLGFVDFSTLAPTRMVSAPTPGGPVA